MTCKELDRLQDAVPEGAITRHSVTALEGLPQRTAASDTVLCLFPSSASTPRQPVRAADTFDRWPSEGKGEGYESVHVCGTVKWEAGGL